MQMAEYGKKIIESREAFIESLGEIIRGIHEKLSGGKEELTLSYEKNVGAEELYDAITRSRERDIRMKTSNVGPHRDDLLFAIGGVDIRKFGSQGQQRTAALIPEVIGDRAGQTGDSRYAGLTSGRCVV